MIDLNRICKKQEADYCPFKRVLRREIIVVYENNCVPECIFNEFPIVVLFFVIRIENTHEFFCFEGIGILNTSLN